MPTARKAGAPKRRGDSARLQALGIGIVALVLASGCAERQPTLEEIRQMHQAGQWEASIEPLRALVKERPGDPETLFLYGRAMWSTGRVGNSLWALKGAMENPDYLLPAGSLFINVLLMNEAWEDAEAACNELLDEVGEKPELLTLRSKARQGSRKNYEGAIEDADRVLELDPDNREVLIPRTVALLSLERVEEAGEALAELDALYRDESLGLKGSSKFCTAGAVFAMEKGELDVSRERFDRCVEEFPASPLLISKALEFYDRMRDPKRSIEVLQGAVAVEPGAQEWRNNLALRLHADGQEEAAEALLLEATEIGSAAARVQAWTSVAAFYLSVDRSDESIECYEKALELLGESRSADLDFRYASALLQAGRFDEAVAFSDRMTVAAHRSLIRGRASLDRSEPAKALEHFTEGNLLWPNNAVARYYTAVAAERVDDFDRAIEEYRYSIRIDPTATNSAERLGHYYQARGEDDEAITIMSLHAGDLETQLEVVRIVARLGRWNTVSKSYSSWVAAPRYRAQSSVAIARGVRDREGTERAVAYLEDVRGLDLTRLRDIAVLAELVEWLPELGRSEDALRLAAAAHEANPESPAFRAIHAVALAATDAERAEVVAELEAVLAIEPDERRAVLSLARTLAATGTDDERAVSLFERAIELDGRDLSAPHELAEFHLRRGRTAEAIAVYQTHLDQQPWDLAATIAYAGVLIDAGGEANLQAARRLVARAKGLGGAGVTERVEDLQARLGAEV